MILTNATAWEASPLLAETNKQRIVIHCESILSAVAYHERRGPQSGGTLAMIFPLKIVCRVTPSDHQRERAITALFNWGHARGISGMCEFAVPLNEGIYEVIRRTEEMRAKTYQSGASH